jgi:hypothetical protein
MNLKNAVRPRKARKTRKKISLLYSAITHPLITGTTWNPFKHFRAFRAFRGQNIFSRMSYTLYLLLALSPITAFGGELELQALLTRIRQSGSAEFHYEETRKLELASSPWQGQGYMLSGADGSLVKQQLQPTRVIMAIAEGRMYYWDPEQKQRHTAPLGQSGQAADLITVFIAILHGHAEDLKSSYDFAAEQHVKRWILRLTPKPGLSNENASTIEISGDEDEHKRQVLIRQPDGESTEYRMVKTSEGPQLENSIQHLLLEAIGD